MNNQQVERRSNALRTALMSQMSDSSPVPTQTSVEEVSTATKAQTQPATTLLQPMTISGSQGSQAVPLMAVSAPTGLPSITPPPPAKPMVAASQIVESRPAAPSTPCNTSPQDDNMIAQPGEGSGDLKRPHDMATPDNDTPSKKTLSEAPACEKSVSTFYCPSLSQTSTVGKVSSVKLFHKLSKNTASRKPTKTSSLQARNYQTTSAVSKTLPGFPTPNKTAKAQARSKVPLPSSTSG